MKIFSLNALSDGDGDSTPLDPNIMWVPFDRLPDELPQLGNAIAIPYLMTHHTLTIGPIFTSTKRPCIPCLQAKSDLVGGETPVDIKTIPVNLLAWFLAQSTCDYLVIYHNEWVQPSRIVPYPFCICQESHAPRGNQPIDLEDNPIQSHNGIRTKSPAQAFDHMMPFMGPWGIIHNLAQTNPDQDLPPVFHSQVLTKHRDGLPIFSAGKGLDKEQARMSAMGEGIERYVASMQKDIPKVTGSFAHLQQKALDPKSLGYPMVSDIPYIHPYSATRDYEWISGKRLSDNQDVLIPANLVFFPYDAKAKEMIFSVETTNGLSGGSSLSEAIIQGIFEVIERDAYWYTMRTNQCFPDISLSNTLQQYMRLFAAKGYKIYLKDLTNDLGIPVAHAVLENMTDAGPAFARGSGSSFSLAQAAIRAITESYQVFQDMGIYFNNLTDKAKELDSPHYRWCFAQNRTAIQHLMETKAPTIYAAKTIDTQSSKKMVQTLVETLNHQNKDVYVVNLSHPSIPYKVVRVLISGIGLVDSMVLTNLLRLEEIATFFNHSTKPLITFTEEIFS